MADDADIANDYILDAVTRALHNRPAGAAKKGAKTCAECGEKMPPARRQLGFQLCIVCATENERQKSLFGGH
ncbi:hypothetical protein AYO45_03440 [Gammaproteobacteria bacterium SCGC AG-212-F23]|nr:hypothetical protein AYO45_03440 [Gammaproteobacteria bacterium SCGC AG-212-F23]